MKDEDILAFILENSHLSNRKIEEVLKVSRHEISKIKKENDIGQVLKRSIKSFNPNIHEFKKIYEKYGSSRKVGKHYGVDKGTVLNYANKIGYKYQHEKLLSDEDIESIKECYHTHTSQQLADLFGCSRERIKQVWMKSGLKGKPPLLYYSNFDYFENINSKDKAYFLGFIAADGCVYQRSNENSQMWLSIAIHSKDEEVLSKLLKYMGSNNPIRRSVQTSVNGTETPTSSIQIVSDKLCGDLERYNIVPRKTWTFYPKNIPSELTSHFIRGVFDGDGSIYASGQEMVLSNHKISFCGNEETINWIAEQLSRMDIDSKKYEDKRNYTEKLYVLNINKNQDKYKLIDYLYNECDDLYLSRKKEKCNTYKDLYKNNKGG